MAEQNPNTEELAELRVEIFVRKLYELTLSPGVVWSRVAPFQYKTTISNNGHFYELWVTQIQEGADRTYEHSLDVHKNGQPFLVFPQRTSSLGSRSTFVKWLYSQVERQVMDTELRIKEGNRVLETTPDCRP